MKVSELIEELKKQNQNSDVVVTYTDKNEVFFTNNVKLEDDGWGNVSLTTDSATEIRNKNSK